MEAGGHLLVASAAAVVVAAAVVADGGDGGWSGRLRGWTSAMKGLERTGHPGSWICLLAREMTC